MIKKLATLLLALLCMPSLAVAEIEKWVDENGKTHYGSRAPKGSNSQYVKTPNAPPIKPLVKKEAVILYSTSWCPYCKKARAYLKKNAIAFTEYDIEKSATAKRNYDAAGGQGVPFMVRGTSSIGGFSSTNYDRFFNRN